jgi:hypothetical protein
VAAWAPALLCLGAFVLTLVEFPGRYFDLVFEDTATIVIVAARKRAAHRGALSPRSSHWLDRPRPARPFAQRMTRAHDSHGCSV